MFKARLDGALSNLVWWEVSLPMAALGPWGKRDGTGAVKAISVPVEEETQVVPVGCVQPQDSLIPQGMRQDTEPVLPALPDQAGK
ncbi:hypothetical protein llap_16868 [Limosa lapponica baueri]|uniref:Uncharacterized protein n=1 Tax=Limosa lapponica baueri TaxID=1758121 RepID=A0A2I0TG97_LIMLA|nr:hypothetical protein llap_16868 [Limosa lapponica baueri]